MATNELKRASLYTGRFLNHAFRIQELGKKIHIREVEIIEEELQE